MARRISKKDTEAAFQRSNRQSKVPRGFEWWTRPSRDVHDAVFAAVKHLDQIQPYRHESFLNHLRMYSNRLGLAAMTGTDFGQSIDQGERIRLNVIKAAIDTAVAHIATNRPRPLYSSVGGTYVQRKRAEGQTKFVAGVFNKVQSYIVGLDQFLDSCIYANGHKKIWQERGEIKEDRVLPDELIFDDNEAKYGHLNQLFQHKELSASVVEAKWNVDASRSQAIREGQYLQRGLEDRVSVVEAWRRPIGEKPGRHVICISDKTLVDETWHRDPPITTFRWSKAPIGFLGISLAEELMPIQVEINYIAQKIQRLMTLQTGIAWVQKGSGTTKRFTNRDGFNIGEYSGRPPIIQTLGQVSAEFFAQLDRLYQRAFELAGISMMQATSTKPPGIEAAEALKTLNDIATKRFLHVGQRYEQTYLDEGELILEAAREAKAQGHRVTSTFQGKKDAELIDFSKVALDKNRYTTRVYPTSIIPETPAGKIDLFERLSQINPILATFQFAFMSGVPDLEAIVDRVNAPRELAEKMVSDILEKGTYTPPFPTMNLQDARNVGAMEFMRGKIDGVPEERLALLHRWNGELDRLIAESRAPTAPAQPGAGAGNGATPPPGASENAQAVAGALQAGTSPETLLNQAVNTPPLQ